MVNAELIFHYFPDLNDTQKAQFVALQEVYQQENEKVNLVSRKDMDNLYVNHILHSLALAKTCQFAPGMKVIDIGTGGGFPGIPLAILFPETEFVLCDSIGKKIRAVAAVAEATGLRNVQATNSRTEALNQQFDVATARAVAPMLSLWNWMQGQWTGKPVFYLLKGGDLVAEMNELLDLAPKTSIRQFPISDIFTEPFFETKKVVEIRA